MTARETQQNRPYELRCLLCGWTTTAAFPLCVDELAAHDCERGNDDGSVA